MKYFIHTFGCQMNQSDSERIAGMLENLGYQKAPCEAGADLVVLNTCVVRQSAQDRIYGKLKNLKKLQSQNPRLKICVAGCMASLYPEKLKGKADLIVPIDDLLKLPNLFNVEAKLALPKVEQARPLQTAQDYLSIIPKYQTTYHAYIPIMTGCNNFCSYCVVPYARGREKSRPVKEIIDEITYLIRKGYKAITLVGQNVNSYRGKIKNQKSNIKNTNQKSKTINFPTLLRLTNNIPGKFWIWFVTSHPKDMSDELINTIADCKKVCPYVHLPVQSGNNQILKAMNRGYTRQHYISLVKKIRKKIPDVALSTDVIVGFPHETKKQFQDTVDLFKKIKFDMAYLARYSPRPKTAAWKLKDSVSLCEKKRREKFLTEILKKTALENNKKLVGKTVEVLIERSDRRKSVINQYGKTQTFKTVKFQSPKNLVGQIVKVKIIQAMPWGLEGKLIK